MNESRFERRIGWMLCGLVLLLFTGIQVFLAGELSLWGDEFCAIEPALRPWSGDKSFWWQIRQYVANPPGENFVLWVLYRVSFFDRFRESSGELFWRFPYILMYGLSGLATYFYAHKWTKSAAISVLALLFFVSSPGPFVWATETRFYTWAVFFMTVGTWETLLFFRDGFDRNVWSRLIVILSVGVLFHLSIALLIYFLLFYSVVQVGVALYKKRSTGLRLRSLFLLLLPFAIYRYEYRFWLFVPGAAVLPAFGRTLSEAPQVIPALLASHLPFGKTGAFVAWVALFLALLFRGVGSIKNKEAGSAWGALLIGALVFGGSLSVLLSVNANGFPVTNRYLLFLVPVVISALLFLCTDLFRAQISRWPPKYRIALMVVASAASVLSGVSLAKNTLANGSPSKIHYDFVGFRRHYSSLTDRRQLVLVGVASGELSGLTDEGAWIAGVHVPYTKDYSPIFLSMRGTPAEFKSVSTDWRRYDFLIFVSSGHEPKIPGLDWSTLSCVPFRWNTLRLCR